MTAIDTDELAFARLIDVAVRGFRAVLTNALANSPGSRSRRPTAIRPF